MNINELMNTLSTQLIDMTMQHVEVLTLSFLSSYLPNTWSDTKINYLLIDNITTFYHDQFNGQAGIPT